VRLFRGGLYHILDGVCTLFLEGADGVVIILIYVDSYLFVCSTSILQVGVGLSNDHASCEYRLRPRGEV
jgi:hypothetical protein